MGIFFLNNIYCLPLQIIEWFSVQCRKTKTKVITLANHKEHTQYSEPKKLEQITGS